MIIRLFAYQAQPVLIHHAVFVEARCRTIKSGCAPPTYIPDHFPLRTCLPVSNLFLSPISLWTCQACPPIGGVHVYTRMPSTSLMTVTNNRLFWGIPHCVGASEPLYPVWGGARRYV